MKRSFPKQLCLFGSVFVVFSMIFTSFLISAFPVSESKAAPEPTSSIFNEQSAVFESYYTACSPYGLESDSAILEFSPLLLTPSRNSSDIRIVPKNREIAYCKISCIGGEINGQSECVIPFGQTATYSISEPIDGDRITFTFYGENLFELDSVCVSVNRAQEGFYSVSLA